MAATYLWMMNDNTRFTKMKRVRKNGFNLIELTVVTVVVFLAASVFLSLIANQVAKSKLQSVGVRGRDIYIAIAGANTERESLGLSSVWPADGAFAAESSESMNGHFDFDNSTDYFRYLYDESRVGTSKWSPWVAGFDYTKLAGGGVSVCCSGKLTPEHNIWTIAKNVRETMADTIPVLITRNIDAASLFSKVREADFDKRLRPDPEWETPFGAKYLVAIKKGGAVFKAREKYMVCGSFYTKTTFDATLTDREAAHPLKYLSPTREIVPGEKVQRMAPAQQTLSERVKRRLSLEIQVAKKSIGYVSIGWGIVYLIVGIGVCEWRHRKYRVSGLEHRALVLGFIHYLAVVALSCALFLRGVEASLPWSWIFLPVSALLILTGVLFARRSCRHDRQLCRRGTMWMLAVPLVTASPYAACFLFLLAVTYGADLLERFKL